MVYKGLRKKVVVFLLVVAQLHVSAGIFDTKNFLETLLSDPYKVNHYEDYPIAYEYEYYEAGQKGRGNWVLDSINRYTYSFDQDGRLLKVRKIYDGGEIEYQYVYDKGEYVGLDWFFITNGTVTQKYSMRRQNTEKKIVERYSKNEEPENEIVYDLDAKNNIVRMTKTIPLSDGRELRYSNAISYDSAGRISCFEIEPNNKELYTYATNSVTITHGGVKDIVTFKNGKVVSRISYTPYGQYYASKTEYTYDMKGRLICEEKSISYDKSIVFTPHRRYLFYYEQSAIPTNKKIVPYEP